MKDATRTGKCETDDDAVEVQQLGNSTDGKQLVSRESFFKAVRVLWKSFPEYTDAKTYSFFFIFNNGGQLTLDMKAFYAPGKIYQVTRRQVFTNQT